MQGSMSRRLAHQVVTEPPTTASRDLPSAAAHIWSDVKAEVQAVQPVARITAADMPHSSYPAACAVLSSHGDSAAASNCSSNSGSSKEADRSHQREQQRQPALHSCAAAAPFAEECVPAADALLADSELDYLLNDLGRSLLTGTALHAISCV